MCIRDSLVRVGYFLGKDHILYRFEYHSLYGNADDPAEVDRASPFISNVLKFRVECFHNGQFRAMNWDSNGSPGGLPRAVRITVQVVDPRHLQDYNGIDDDGDGVVDDYDETGDDVGMTFQHVVYLGDRSR